MSDAALRSVERAYKAGTATRLEWLAARARVEPEVVRLASYLRDPDAAVVMPWAVHYKDHSLQRWATELRWVCNRAAWPDEAQVHMRCGLALAQACMQVWLPRICGNAACGEDRHSNSAVHADDARRLLAWMDRVVAGRTTLTKLREKMPGFGAFMLNYPFVIAVDVRDMLRGMVFPGDEGPSLERVVRHLFSQEVEVGLAQKVAERCWGQVAAEVAPWVLGERDAVRARLLARGERVLA